MAAGTDLVAKVDYYPRTVENRETNFKNWSCPHCTGTDPETDGGTVAHLKIQFNRESKDKGVPKIETIIYDGQEHPEHRNCLLTNYQYRTTCASCRIELDPSKVMTRIQKLAAFINHLPTHLGKWTQHSKALNGSGFLLLCIGISWKIPAALAVASVCFARGLQHSSLRQSSRAARAQLISGRGEQYLRSLSQASCSITEITVNADQIQGHLQSLATELQNAGGDFDHGAEILPLIAQIQAENAPDLELIQQISQRAIASLQQAKTMAGKLKRIAYKETIYSWAISGARKCAQLAGIVFGMYTPYAYSRARS